MLCFCFSSCGFNNSYKIKDGVVYFEKPNIKDFQYNKGGRKMEYADAKTFKILKDGSYAKDKNNVFQETLFYNLEEFLCVLFLVKLILIYSFNTSRYLNKGFNLSIDLEIIVVNKIMCLK